MAAKLTLCALLAYLVCLEAKTVIVGDMFGSDRGADIPTRLIYQKRVELNHIPLLKREEEVYYAYPNPGLKIRGIAIRDLDDSPAEASITRGGIGFDFVNIKLKSERSYGLNYIIEVYA